MTSGKIGTNEARPVQRWARAASWTAFACALPPVAWRLAMLAGAPTGFAEAESFRTSAGATLYVLILETIEVGAGVACLALAMPWSERIPSWVPCIGGRRIPRQLPLVVGGGGNALLYLVVGVLGTRFTLAWSGAVPGWTPTDGMNAVQTAVLSACYAPMVVWPVALSVALVGFARRTR